MERELPLLEDGVQRGHILCREEGCYVTFAIDAPMWESGVKKVWIYSENGGRLLLGTLLPEQQRLKLDRRVSHSALRCCGVGVPALGQINPREEQDDWYATAALRLPDPELREGLASAPPGRWRRRAGRIELRFPWCVGQAVPLVSLFCLAQAQGGWWHLSLPEEPSHER